jgi:hypothetical protein
VRRLDDKELDRVCAAIANRTRAWIAGHDSAQRHDALERRRIALGGMLELARRLEDYGLVRFIENHKDALTRLIEAD